MLGLGKFSHVAWKRVVLCACLFLVVSVLQSYLTFSIVPWKIDLQVQKLSRLLTGISANESVQDVMKIRLQQIEHRCRAHNRNAFSTDIAQVLNQTNPKFIIVDDVNKVMFCYVGKAGNSHWKAVMAVLGGAVKRAEKFKFNNVSEVPTKTGTPIHEPWFFKKLSDFTVEEAERMLRDKDFKKFMSVRHPYTRLLSAYKDKFALDNVIVRQKYRRLYGNYIIRRYQKGNVSAAEPGYEVSWNAFAEYVADCKLETCNEHWEIQNKLCNPCAFKYDFITLLEESVVEAPYWLKQLEVHTGRRGGMSYKKAYNNHVGYERARDYFSKLPRRVVAGLYERYESDFELFGYKPEDVVANPMEASTT